MAGGVGRWLAGRFVRTALNPESLLRLAAGRLTRGQLTDVDAQTSVDSLISKVGSAAAAIDVLSTTPEREMAEAQAAHAPVFELELQLSAEESPLVGSGHGLDFALMFQPAGAGTEGPLFSAEQKAAACRDFFGRDALGEPVQRLADGLREAVVRFATTGSPGHLLEVPWPEAHREQPGQMIGSSTPRYEPWGDGISPQRKAVRRAVQALV